MRRLTLCEYQTTPAEPLTSDDRDALAALVPSLTIVPHPDRSGHYDLTPGSWVGGAQVGSMAVEIRPKISIDRLLFLISYSLHRQRWRESLFLARQESDLVEAIIDGFLAQTRRAMTWGLLHGYRAREDALSTVRGRIRFDDQIRNRYGLFPPVEVGYDEFTEDIEENRLLKAAVACLGRLRPRSERIRRGLLEIEGSLAKVQRIDYDPRHLPTISYSRLNEHYQPAVELAKLILRSTSYETSHGGLQASAILVDMNAVFEDFVVLALRDELRLSCATFPQGAKRKRLRLDRAGTIKLYPDLSWWDGAHCTFVGDVKYKRTHSDDAINADLYQLLAYTVATNLPSGLVIYAAGETLPDAHEVLHLGRRLEVVTLNLQGSPAKILQQIHTIADRIRQMRGLAKAPQQKSLTTVGQPVTLTLPR